MPPLPRSHSRSRRVRWLTRYFAWAVLSTVAVAHNPIASWAVLDLQEDRMELKVEMATESAWLFLGEKLDQAPNVQGSLPRLRSMVSKVYELSLDGRVMPPETTNVSLEEEDAVVFRLIYHRPNAGPVHCDAVFLKRLPVDHHSTLTLLEAEKTLRTVLLTPHKHAVDLTLPPKPAGAPALPQPQISAPGNTGAPAAKPAPAPASISFADFFKLGVEHILTGYDHLLFLLGLLVVCRRWSSMLTIITCFTLAHSITLALAALNWVSLPSRVVEPLIATSIVFVGIENLVRREEPKGRWLLTFFFGLIHGFGFAGVLREIGLGAGGTSVALPLFSFNVGVETGQLAVVAVLLPVLWALRQRPVFWRRLEPAISVIVVILGTYWLLRRTVF